MVNNKSSFMRGIRQMLKAESMRDFVQKNIDSYEERISTAGTLIDTYDIIEKFRDKRNKISNELKENLANSNSLRHKDFNQIMEKINGCQEQREIQLKNKLKNFLQRQTTMVYQLKLLVDGSNSQNNENEKTKIDDFKALLSNIKKQQETGEKEATNSLQKFHRDQEKLTQELNNLLKKGKFLRIKDLKTTLNNLRKEDRKMSNVDAMRRIKEDIIDSYDARVANVSDIAKDTKVLMRRFRDETKEMSDALRAELAKVKTGLTAAEKERFQQAQAEISERIEATSQMLSDFQKSHAEMSDTLRAELAKVKTGLTAAEKERFQQAQAEISERIEATSQMLSDFQKSHVEMSDALRAELAKVKPELTAAEKERFQQAQAEIIERIEATSQMLNEFKDEREGMAAQWNELSEILAQKRSLGVEKVRQLEEEKARKQTEKTELRAKAEAEKAEQEKRRAKEQMFEKTKDQIYDIIADNDPDGIKLTAIGDIVGEKWQKLTPYVKQLVDVEQIKKTNDNFYILAA